MPEKRYFQKQCYCSEGLSTPTTDWSDEIDGYSPLQAMGKQELPLEIHKLIFTVFILLVAGFSNWTILAFIHDFVPRQPLPDIFSSFLPEKKWALKVADSMVTLSSICIIAIFVLHKHRAIVIRRTLFILAMLYFFRAISMISTQLPSNYANNNRECREMLDKNERTFFVYLKRVLEQSIHFGLQDSSKRLLCGDMLYSGHTLIMVISSLTVEHYLPHHLRLCQYIPKFFTIVGIVCLILSRTHYTIDIFFGYIISIGVFSIYHAFTEIDTSRERKQSMLYKLWIMRLVFWLEENVMPGKIENEISVPIIPRLYRNIHAYFTRKKQSQPTINSTSSTIVTVVP